MKKLSSSSSPIYGTVDSSTISMSRREYNKILRQKAIENGLLSDATPKESMKMLKGVFFIILVVTLFYAITGQDRVLTFTGFLQVIENAPHVPIDWIKYVPELLSSRDWGIMKVLSPLLDPLLSILSVLLYITMGFVQIFTYIGYFVYTLL